MRPIDADKMIESIKAQGDIVRLFGIEELTSMTDMIEEVFLQEIENAPTIEIPHWIPCSERLPEEETDVLVTRKFLGCKDGSHGWNNHIPPSTYVEVAQYFNGEWTAFSDEYKMGRHTEPVAWMPLPEPYREEEK